MGPSTLPYSLHANLNSFVKTMEVDVVFFDRKIATNNSRSLQLLLTSVNVYDSQWSCIRGTSNSTALAQLYVPQELVPDSFT